METERRLLIAPARSGSTALTRALAEHPEITCVKGGVGRRSSEHGGNESYAGYTTAVPTKWAVLKASFASIPGMSDFNPFPNKESVAEVRPLFLFRDPHYTWQSCARQPWADFTLFLEAYKNAHELMMNQEGEIRCSTYEDLVKNPEGRMKQILNYWSIPWDSSVIHWQKPFGSQTFIPATSERGVLFEKNLKAGLHSTLMGTNTFEPCNQELQLEKHLMEKIEEALSWRYKDAASKSGEWQCLEESNPR